MSPELFALLERVHGHLAVLGLAVLLHPVITLRTRRGLSWRTHLSAELGAGLLAVPFVLGWAIYPAYRAHIKPALFAADHPGFHAFETKEHLAAMATFLALGGAVALRAAGKTPEGRTAAWWMLALAWLLGATTGVLGIWIAASSAPGWA